MLCPDHQPEFLVLGLEVEVMHTVGEVLRSFESALDKRLVDDHLGDNAHQFRSLPRLTSLRIGPKLRRIRSTYSRRAEQHRVFCEHRREHAWDNFSDSPGFLATQKQAKGPNDSRATPLGC